jgi:hypothetical protein
MWAVVPYLPCTMLFVMFIKGIVGAGRAREGREKTLALPLPIKQHMNMHQNATSDHKTQ